MSVREAFIPLPHGEPSAVLFNMLSALIDIGKQMSSSTDILAGVPQGQNTPVGTTLAMIEQGMKQIDASYKRVYRSLKKELKLLYRLNNIYLQDDVYKNVTDDNEANVDADFNLDDFDVEPVGDTRISSQVMRHMKAKETLDMALQLQGVIDIKEAARRVLVAMDVSDIEALIPEGMPPEEMMQKLMEADQIMKAMNQQIEQMGQALQDKERTEAREDKKVQQKDTELSIKDRDSMREAQKIGADIEVSVADQETKEELAESVIELNEAKTVETLVSAATPKESSTESK